MIFNEVTRQGLRRTMFGGPISATALVSTHTYNCVCAAAINNYKQYVFGNLTLQTYRKQGNNPWKETERVHYTCSDTPICSVTVAIGVCST